VVERVDASLGKSSSASSIFEKSRDICNGGVIFSLPALIANGLLKHTHTYFHLPSGYYTLSQLFISLAFIVLLRIKTIESIKSYSPGELGKLIGLDRIPEIKTIRKKLGLLASQNRSKDWSRELSKDWMAQESNIRGLLYIDGHVRVYHGNQTKLPRRYVAREKLCLRGMSDYWLNDALGRPFFVVTTALNSGLLSILRDEIIPRLLRDVPSQPSAEELERNKYKSRFSIIFDREGYSPVFIKEVWEKHRISCYTYNKYPKEDWPESEFSEHIVRLHNGEEVIKNLGERGTFIGKKIWVREIRKLTESGHQTAVISTDYETKAQDLAANMFARWSQENFFKYMRENFGIDKLVEYETIPIDETKKIKNPQYSRLEKQIRSLNQKLTRKIAAFGAITLAWEGEKEGQEEKEKEKEKEKEIEKYASKKAELNECIEFYKEKLEKLKAIKKETQKHIQISQLPENESFSSLANEKKHIMDNIKMIAYRAETAMANIIKPVMAKGKEARMLLRQIFTTDIDLEPDYNNNTLYVVLHSLSDEKSNKIVRYLCDQLNQTETIFPDTNLKLFFKSVSNKNPPGQEL
jgi:hypothetical protein